MEDHQNSIPGLGLGMFGKLKQWNVFFSPIQAICQHRFACVLRIVKANFLFHCIHKIRKGVWPKVLSTLVTALYFSKNKNLRSFKTNKTFIRKKMVKTVSDN